MIILEILRKKKQDRGKKEMNEFSKKAGNLKRFVGEKEGERGRTREGGRERSL